MHQPAVVFGEGGGTVLVLLHQTDRDGLCGWTPFSRAAVAEGFTTLAFDMCGWGGSDCPDDWSLRSSDQVEHAVEHARTALEAERVVLVMTSSGTSTGH